MFKRILVIVITALVTFLLLRNCGVNEAKIEQKELITIMDVRVV